MTNKGDVQTNPSLWRTKPLNEKVVVSHSRTRWMLGPWFQRAPSAKPGVMEP